MEPPPDALRTFRRSFYECLHRRGEALFELTDAILGTDASAPSPVHLSLQPVHRRGWGSFYAALARGRSDARLRRGHERVAPMRRGVQPRARLLLPSFSPFGGAADRRRLGLPVRRTAQLRPRELDRPRGCRARPSRPRRQRARRRTGEVVPTTPRFVVRGRDRRYPPVRLRRGLRSRQDPTGARGMSLPDPRPFASGASLLRRPEPVRPAGTHRTPRRHGPKMKCSEPSTWPDPSAEHRCEDAGYGSVRVRAWAELHPKVHNHAGKGTRGPLPIVVGTLILVEVERLPRGERRREPRVLWLWWHGPEGTAPDLDLLWRSYVRRFDLEHTFRFLKQSMGWTTPRVRHPEQADRWTWLVVAAYTQLRLARARVADLRLPWERRYDRGRLTPVRVHRAVSALLAELGTPAKAPKPCGRSPGRPKGRLSGRAKRYPAIKTAA